MQQRMALAFFAPWLRARCCANSNLHRWIFAWLLSRFSGFPSRPSQRWSCVRARVVLARRGMSNGISVAHSNRSYGLKAVFVSGEKTAQWV